MKELWKREEYERTMSYKKFFRDRKKKAQGVPRVQNGGLRTKYFF